MSKDARKLSREALLERRRQAVRLSEQGWQVQQIAATVGAHRNTVGRWIAAWRDEGEAALVPMPAGRPCGSGMTLSPRDARKIQRIITDRYPDQLKLPFALWTRGAVQQLIRKQLGIRMPIRTVGEYLKRWGFTPQKPLRQAYERCPQAVQRWVNEQYPAIANQAKAEGGEIHWGDQTGLRSDDQVGRGYAPKGKTPVRRSRGTPEKVNMISTVTNQGKVRFMFYRGSMNARRLIEFMRRLIKDAKRKVFLILDNLRVHHGKKVKNWLADRKDQIEVFYLPSYSPDLNPDEYLNCDLKAGVSAKPDRREKMGMRRTALSHMRMLQQRPDRVRKYFEHPSICYAA